MEGLKNILIAMCHGGFINKNSTFLSQHSHHHLFQYRPGVTATGSIDVGQYVGNVPNEVCQRFRNENIAEFIHSNGGSKRKHRLTQF